MYKELEHCIWLQPAKKVVNKTDGDTLAADVEKLGFYMFRR